MIVCEDVVIVDQISVYLILPQFVPVMVDPVLIDISSGADHRQGLSEREQVFLVLRQRKSRLFHDIGAQEVDTHQIDRLVLLKAHIVPDEEGNLVMLLGLLQASVFVKACQAVDDFRHIVARLMIPEGHDDGRLRHIFLKIPDQLLICFIRFFDQGQVALRGHGHRTLIHFIRQQYLLFETVVG